MFGIKNKMDDIYSKAKADLTVFLSTQGQEFIKDKKLVVKPTFKDGFTVEFSLEDKN